MPTLGERSLTRYHRTVPGEIREQILTAAEECIRVHGMARVTTKDVARHAGCSEGSIYNHFADKLDLLRAVIDERLPDVLGVVGALSDGAGTGSVRDHVAVVLEVAEDFYRRLLPLAGSLCSDPELLARCQGDLAEEGGGPHEALAAIGAYVRAEQALGRVAEGIDPDAVALAIMGSAAEAARIELVTGTRVGGGDWRAGVLDLLCAALAPHPAVVGPR